MDELKNLVIQSLETNGVLGQVRAQLRSCVFKVIDNQDQVEKRQSSFHWENPHARKLREDETGSLMAELVREFLEFYRLDYTLAIYGPETNLKERTPDKQDLADRAGIQGQSKDRPLLLTLFESFMDGRAAGPIKKSPKKEIKPIEPLSMSNLPDSKHSAAVSKNDDTEKRLAKANNLLEEMSREEKGGFSLADGKKSNDGKSGRESGLTGKSNDKKSADDDIEAYDDDEFDDDIEEDLPDGQDDPVDDHDAGARSTNIGNSGQGITVSQSLGVDPSVDSLALEEYDHIEPVERLA